jgi:CubicO group peptidase (beta-lactamase class C family)
MLRLTVLAVALGATTLAHADAALQSFLEKNLAMVRAKAHLPGAAALVQIRGKITAEAALGVRAEGHAEPVTTLDRWHIGSNTKAFTATLIARLCERRVMSFDDTLAASFPALAKTMHPAYRSVTVSQLLSHTAGLSPLTDDKELPAFKAAIAAAHGVKAQRAAAARHYLTIAPASKAGEFSYSNLGFIVAGAIAEARTGKTWEALIEELVFAPLGIKNAGFGLPGKSGSYDQPRGHKEGAGMLTPLDPADPDADNPFVIGPAGTIHIALKDWLLFAQDQLDGTHGRGKLLRPETYRRLHRPVTGNYALGWGVKVGADGAPLLLTHTGSNGFWIADIRIMPKQDVIVLFVMNAGNDAANQAVKDFGMALKARLPPLDSE